MDMFCPNCNKLFPSDHHYCYICGAALLEHTDTNNMSDNESELETDNNIWEPWDTEDDVYSEVSDSSDSVASVDDDVEVIEDFDDDEVIEDSDDDYDEFDYNDNSWEPIGNIWENDDAIWGTVDSISDTADDEAEKENYDPIYMKELETYDIDCVEITKSDITKRYIQVHINNMFKFCPDFTPDLDTKGKCFLHDDYVIMAFCRSGQLGIYKIKVNGKKVSLLFSIDYNKDDDIFSFYEVIDGRYILCCASKVLFFNPDDKDASFEVFDMDIRISGINALYSGSRMLLTPYERESQIDMFGKSYDYSEYNNYTAVIWFDGHQTIDVLKTEWFKKCSEICDNYVYNYCVNNFPEYLSIDSKTNEIYISGYKNKFCIIPSEGLRFSCSCSYDYFISIISAKCNLKMILNLHSKNVLIIFILTQICIFLPTLQMRATALQLPVPGFLVLMRIRRI
ncbi:MAG: hypothetical protein J6A05_05815 [Oscillospiraceae bacterium]|nr:hypothetical protein [Oscillospiraceae bacterium]